MLHKAYIGFGANLGDVLATYGEVKRLFTLLPDTQLSRASPLYRTEPLSPDGQKQNWYLNGVFEIQTTLTLHLLFKALKKIEKKLGRDMKSARWSPRLVDLDILFYDDFIYRDRTLMVPHREIINRKFVLKPLCDLIPDFIHPDIELSLSEIYANTNDTLAIAPLS